MTDEFAPATSNADAENSGPLEERLVAKNWSIRAKAFEELTECFKGATSPQDALFSENGPCWKKYLGDINPGSLEKCLEALMVFIDKADPSTVAASQNDIIKVLIEKCNNHAKPIIKEKGFEASLFLFEVSEQFEGTVPVFEDTLRSKNIKVRLIRLPDFWRCWLMLACKLIYLFHRSTRLRWQRSIWCWATTV